MHRSLRIALVFVHAALAGSLTALGVTGSSPDGNGHPYVGALVADGAVRCSGVLIAPRVLATAAHCGADGARVSVSFDSELAPGGASWRGRSRRAPRSRPTSLSSSWT